MLNVILLLIAAAIGVALVVLRLQRSAPPVPAAAPPQPAAVRPRPVPQAVVPQAVVPQAVVPQARVAPQARALPVPAEAPPMRPIYALSPSRPPNPAPARVAQADDAPTTVLAAPTLLLLKVNAGPEAGMSYMLLPGDNHMGRAPECQIRLTDTSVSSRHAIFRVTGNQILLFDNASTNGTFVNGRRVMEPVLLKGGEQIAIGQTTLQIQLEARCMP